MIHLAVDRHFYPYVLEPMGGVKVTHYQILVRDTAAKEVFLNFAIKGDVVETKQEGNAWMELLPEGTYKTVINPKAKIGTPRYICKHLILSIN